MDRHKRVNYHPKWELIVRLIHRRAAGHCEQCGVKAFSYIRRSSKRFGGYRYATESELAKLTELSERGTKDGWGRRKALRYLRLTYVHLEVGHLDRDLTNNRFGNLRAFCQACHLNHDRPQHLRSRSYGRLHDRKDQLTIFNKP